MKYPINGPGLRIVNTVVHDINRPYKDNKADTTKISINIVFNNTTIPQGNYIQMANSPNAGIDHLNAANS